MFCLKFFLLKGMLVPRFFWSYKVIKCTESIAYVSKAQNNSNRMKHKSEFRFFRSICYKTKLKINVGHNLTPLQDIGSTSANFFKCFLGFRLSLFSNKIEERVFRKIFRWTWKFILIVLVEIYARNFNAFFRCFLSGISSFRNNYPLQASAHSMKFVIDM